MKADCHACIDGTNVHDGMHELDIKSHVVVGTPGCVYDMIVGTFLHTQFIEIFVLNKDDKIWSRDFQDQTKKVFKLLKEGIQVILLSATMSEDILDITTHLMCNPVHILVEKEELTLEGL